MFLPPNDFYFESLKTNFNGRKRKSREKTSAVLSAEYYCNIKRKKYQVFRRRFFIFFRKFIRIFRRYLLQTLKKRHNSADFSPYFRLFPTVTCSHPFPFFRPTLNVFPRISPHGRGRAFFGGQAKRRPPDRLQKIFSTASLLIASIFDFFLFFCYAYYKSGGISVCPDRKRHK